MKFTNLTAQIDAEKIDESTNLLHAPFKQKSISIISDKSKRILPADLHLYKMFGLETVTELYNTAMKRISKLPRGVNLKSKDIVGHDRWSNTDSNEHINIGIIIGALAKERLLPLRRVENNGQNAAQYQRV